VTQVGEAFVEIKADLSGFDSSVRSGVAAAMKDVEATVEKSSKRISDSLKDAGKKIGDVGKKMSDLGGDLTKKVTLPIVGIGTAAVGAATTVDKALRDIRVGTGATGDTLDQLEEDFRVLARNSSGSIGRVGTVVADLNTRLGLTSGPMQELAGNVLDLEQILGGTEVNLDTLTRVFGAFRVEPEKYSETLNKLFRASQATGVEFNALQGVLVSQSAAFGELGFGIDDTIAILGQFEKAGVNTETVLGGLRVSIGKAAAEGEDAATFFRNGVKRIEEFIAAGDEAGAQAEARELFGARTFLDALDAIRRGQFNIDDTVDQIRNGADTIDELAIETEQFGEKFAKFRNQMTLSIAPLGEKLLPLLTQALDRVLPMVDRVIELFTNLSPRAKTIGGVMLGVAAALGPVLLIGGKLITIIGGLVTTIGFVISPVGLVVIAIAALVAGLVIAYQRSETFRNIVHRIVEIVKTLAERVVEFAQAAWPVLKAAFESAIEIAKQVADFFVAIWDRLYAVVEVVLPAVISLLGAFWQWIDTNVISTLRLGLEFVFALWQRLVPVIKAVVDQVISVLKLLMSFVKAWINVLRPIIEAFLSALSTAFSIAFNAIRSVVEFVLNSIRSTIEFVLGVIRGIFQVFTGLLTGDFGKAWDGIKGIASAAMTFLKDTIRIGLDFVRNLFTGTFDAIVDFLRGVPGKISAVASGMFNGIKEAFRGVINFIIRGWNSLNFRVPGFKVGPIGYDGFTLGLPKIPELANGAIITQPTLAVVGEAGPEVVLPLSRPNRAQQLADAAGLSIGSGALVNIQSATFMDGTDADLVAQKVNAAYRARVLVA
jgi:TP901 family phage tail tape measure protein